MSTVRANNYYDASGGSNAQLYGVASPPNSMGFRNRIINGDMRIDQRNAGASVTSGFPVDRFQVYSTQSGKWTAQRSTVAPAGFTNSVVITSSGTYTPISSDYFSFTTRIEGNNVADLGWGAAGASAVTVSFWVRSSLTGTFTGALHNNAFNRVYPFSYTINAANTWEQKIINIAGDTSGTWLTDNSVGIEIGFAVSVGSSGLGTAGAWASTANIFGATGQVNLLGTNGATFYITGVQLEAGTVASPFERRDYGRELMMCQRYYAKILAGSIYTYFGNAQANSSGGGSMWFTTPVTMRASPTFSYSALGWYQGGVVHAVTSLSTQYFGRNGGGMDTALSGASLVAGYATAVVANNNANAYVDFAAEL